MTLPTLLLQLHGDDPRMALVYFWSAVLIALTPVLTFGGLGVWLLRKYLRERKLGAGDAPPPGTMR